MKKNLKADLMLVIVTLGWGISYYLMDIALSDVDAFTLNAYRFLGAFFVAGLITFNKIKSVNRETLKYSIFVGVALFFVYTGATFGVKYTTLSNSGFLCALAVMFVPIFEFLFFRKKPERKIVFAVTVSLIGIMLLMSLFAIPQMIAEVFTSRFKPMLVLASAASLVCSVSGLFISYWSNVPASATIVVTLIAVYSVARLLSSLKRKSHRNKRQADTLLSNK